MAGKLMVGIGVSGEFPGDQRDDDQQSQIFDTGQLEKALNLVGQPVLKLRLSSDQPVANLAARLCDVHPGGESTLITYGVLNLAHRDSNESPEALTPGTVYDVNVKLNHMAYQIPAKHVLRLALSNAYWPLVWPSPFRDTLSIHLSACHLNLPVKPHLNQVNNPALKPFAPQPATHEKELRATRTDQDQRNGPGNRTRHHHHRKRPRKFLLPVL